MPTRLASGGSAAPSRARRRSSREASVISLMGVASTSAASASSAAARASSCAARATSASSSGSRALTPEHSASINSVDVTSFSLKKRLTMAFSTPARDSAVLRRCRSPSAVPQYDRNPASAVRAIRASSVRRSSTNRLQIPSTLVRYTRTSSRRYCASRHLKGLALASLMTCTCAFITNVSLTVKPSASLSRDMNFFHPQSCSFLLKRCSVSEYLDFLGSRFTTAIVNCAKCVQPGSSLS